MAVALRGRREGVKKRTVIPGRRIAPDPESRKRLDVWIPGSALRAAPE
jgi:hypothetical protein